MATLRSVKALNLFCHWLFVFALTLFFRAAVWHKRSAPVASAVWAASFVFTVDGVRWWTSRVRLTA